MATIFEDMMTANRRAKKVNRLGEAKKISYKKLKVESVKVLHEGDYDELEKEFIADPEESEVVLVLDPEIPYEDEVPEDAAEKMIGDVVFKCPICGANYACDCKDPADVFVTDEEGIPTECPICGDEAEQIILGEIAPVESEEDADSSMRLQDNDDDQEDSEADQVKNESLEEATSQARLLIGYDELEDYLSTHGSRFYCTINTSYSGWSIVRGQNEFNLSEVMSNLKAKYPRVKEFRVDPEEPNRITAKTSGKSRSNPDVRERQTIFINIRDYKSDDNQEDADVAVESMTNATGKDLGKYQMWVDYDMKHYGHISEETEKFIKDAGLELVKDTDDQYEVVAKECMTEEIDDCIDCDEYEVVDAEAAPALPDTPLRDGW